jgi:hypothetical protein
MDITNNATFQNSMKEQQLQIPPYTWAQKLLFHVNLPFDQSIEIRDIGWSEFVMAIGCQWPFFSDFTVPNRPFLRENSKIYEEWG